MGKITTLKPFRFIASVLAVLTLMVSNLQAQVAVTATAGTATGTYTTVSAAFAAINAGTHQGVINITISANTTEPATVVALVNSGFGAASYTDITIKPSGNVTVNSAATPTSNRGLIELNGADNVTIDGDDPATAGDRNLTFQMAVLPAASTTITAVIRLSSNSTTGTNGANNNTVKNCIIIGSRTSATTTTVSYGINMSNYSTTSLLTGAYSSINTVIENNEIRRCHRGVYANGASSLYPNTGLIIRNNIMGSATADLNIGERPIYVACSNTSGVATSALIEGNDVRAGAVSPTGSGYATTLVGIDLGTANSNIRIIRNNIHDIIQPGLTSGAYGIQNGGAASCDNYLIANNFINNIVAAKSTTTLTSTFAACGIRIFAGSTLMRIVNNTIVVNAAQAGTTANYVSHGVVFTATTPTVSQFLNNIVVNNNTGAGTYAIYSASNNIWTTAVVNNNNYYVPNGLIGYYNGSNQATMANWQAAIGQDANSFNVAPNFVSVNDIHITSAATPLESAGAPVSITNVTVDFDNQVRPGPVGSVNGGATNPDIGADEFDATPILAPTVTLGSITPINCTTASSHPVSVTASPGSGTMTSVVLNYAFNGVAQTPISMTNTSGSIYEATIPAATPVNATVTWSVTATNSFSLPITYTGAAYQDQSLLGVTAVANNSLSPVCAGSPSNLSVILSGLAAPNYTLPVVTQALFDEDLGTVVISQGGVDIINNVSVINSLNGTIGTATGTAGSYSNYTAFGPYTLNAGQTYNFSLSSLTTGTAYLNHMRIYIDLNRNGSFADAGECMYVPAANVSGAHTETGSFTIPASAFNGLTRMRVFCYEGAPAAAYINTFGYGEYEDYMINMVSTNSGGGFVPAITSASWSDGTTTLGAGNPYTINPTSTATYTATVTAAGCTVVSSPTTVTALVLPSSVTATNSSQCGSAVPTASVASTAGTSGTGSFYWYSAATGGTTLQSPPLTPIPATSCTYTFNLFDSFGDGWNGATMQVLNGATVVATIGGTFTTGLTATQTVTLQSGTTYTLFWNAAGAYPEEVGVTVLNPAGATIYTMAPVFPNPNVNTTLTTIIADCSTAPPSGFTTGVGYTTFQTAVAATTTFYVSELGTNGCYSTPTPVVVTVSNPDPISFSAGATPSICLGATFNTTASSVNTAYAYSYALSSYTGSGLSAGVTGASVSTTPTTAGVYTFTVTGTDGICTAVTPMPLTVNALPVLTSATATPTTACHNAVVDLAASSIVSGPQTLPSGYCTTNNSGGTGSLMNNVVFGSISNNTAASNPTAAPYYSNYTLTTNVQPGNTYPLSVTISPAGTYTGAIISVWIDYNRDGTLAATEWQQVAVNAPGGTTATINVNVPASAQMGLTKMRIRTRGSGNPNGAGDACSSMGSGETEDYLVNIQSQPAIPYSYTWNSTPVVNTMLGTTVVSNTTAAP
ncbi:MAG: beta strand repeat-containing protein, partial [Flavobacteriia bacterium]